MSKNRQEDTAKEEEGEGAPSSGPSYQDITQFLRTHGMDDVAQEVETRFQCQGDVVNTVDSQTWKKFYRDRTQAIAPVSPISCQSGNNNGGDDDI